MTTDISFNGVDLSSAVPAAAVLSVRRPLLGARRTVHVDVPGRPGSIPFADQPGDRLITIHLDLQAASFAARRAAVVALATYLDLDAPANLIVDDQPDRYWSAMLDSSPDVLEQLVSADVELQFRVGPYASAVDVSTASDTLTGGSDAMVITVPDDVDADPIVELTPTDGTLTAVTITRDADSLSWAGTIAQDDTLTISSVSKTATTGPNVDVGLTGAYDPDDVVMSAAAGRFPYLVNGDNTVAVEWDGTANTVDITVTWRRRYR